MSRLTGSDRRRMAQVGAADWPGIPKGCCCLSCESGPELDSDPDRPSLRRVWFRQRHPAYASYLFKHALVQDAAYSTNAAGADRVLPRATSRNPRKSQFAESPSASRAAGGHTQRPADLEVSAPVGQGGRQRFTERSAWSKRRTTWQALGTNRNLPRTADCVGAEFYKVAL